MLGNHNYINGKSTSQISKKGTNATGSNAQIGQKKGIWSKYHAFTKAENWSEEIQMGIKTCFYLRTLTARYINNHLVTLLLL